MTWIVLKYGGSSLTSKGFTSIIQRIKNINTIKAVIVFSAIQNTTNLLIKFTKTLEYKIIEEIKKIINN